MKTSLECAAFAGMICLLGQGCLQTNTSDPQPRAAGSRLLPSSASMTQPAEMAVDAESCHQRQKKLLLVNLHCPPLAAAAPSAPDIVSAPPENTSKNTNSAASPAPESSVSETPPVL